MTMHVRGVGVHRTAPCLSARGSRLPAPSCMDGCSIGLAIAIVLSLPGPVKQYHLASFARSYSLLEFNRRVDDVLQILVRDTWHWHNRQYLRRRGARIGSRGTKSPIGRKLAHIFGAVPNPDLFVQITVEGFRNSHRGNGPIPIAKARMPRGFVAGASGASLPPLARPPTTENYTVHFIRVAGQHGGPRHSGTKPLWEVK